MGDAERRERKEGQNEMMRRWGLEDDEVHYKTGLCTRRVRFSAFKNSFTDVK